MVGGIGWGVNFGGEFGGLARNKSFFQKTLEVRRGGFWRGWGGMGEGRGRRSERWKGGARWERLGRLRGVGAGWLGGTEDVAAGGYRLGVVREETRPGAGFQRHDERAAVRVGAFWGNTRPPARLPQRGSRAGRAWALARFPERVCKVLEPGTGRQGAGAAGGDNAELRRTGRVAEGSLAVRHRRLERGMWFGRLTASGWVGEPARGGRNEADERQERGQELREPGEEHWEVGCRTYSDSVHYLGTSGKWLVAGGWGRGRGPWAWDAGMTGAAGCARIGRCYWVPAEDAGMPVVASADGRR